MKKYFLVTGFWVLSASFLWAQDTLTLTLCYQAALENYPLAKQKGLFTQTGDLAIANLKANRWLPQVAVNGQATWQSEVTRLPIEMPGVQVPELSKDQYKVTLDASYMLYDGEVNRSEQELQKTNTAIEGQQVDVELNRLKEQVNLFFLQALLAEENIRLTEAIQRDLQNRIARLTANVQYGSAAQTTVDALQAEYWQTEQKMAALVASRKGLKEMLAILTGLPIDATTPLQIGVTAVTWENLANQRPEMKLYQLQRSQLDVQTQLTRSKLRPRLSAFAQTGLGRPALNFLDNDFRSFFLGGIRLSWPISNGYNLRREQAILSLKKQLIDHQQEAFEQKLALQLRQQQSEIEQYEALISTDRQIVALRNKLKESAAAQLENGAIAARDYLSELYAESQAVLNLSMHQLQWQMAKVQYVTLMGN